MPTIDCDFHFKTPATNNCQKCFIPLCDSCITDHKGKVLCKNCVSDTKKSKKNNILLATISLIAGAFLLYQYGPGAKKRKIISEFKSNIIEKNCELTTALNLIKKLQTNKEFTQAGLISRLYLKECNENIDIRTQSYVSHKYAQNFDEALKDVNVLIKNDPYDKDYWGWKGQIYELKQEYAPAVQAYREVTKLTPKIMNIPMNLVYALEKLKKFCAAHQELERYASIYPELRNQPKITHMFKDLQKKGKCHGQYSKGEALVNYDPSVGNIFVSVVINGKHKGLFVLDTGASTIALSQSFADKINNLEEMGTVTTATANGLANAKLSQIQKLQLKGISAQNLDVLVLNKDLGKNIDGLLGMNFLSRFNMQMDSSKGSISLKSKI